LPALRLGSDPESVREASMIVRRGGVVAFPTDTVYGLGCDPLDAAALARLFEAKGREGKPVSVLCAALADAERLVVLGDTALALADAHWPGPLTIVAPLRVPVPRLLDQGSGWLGVRVPDDRVSLSLASYCGGAVTGTSANVSGRPSCHSAGEVALELGDRIDAILDDGERGGVESTVVRVDGRAVEVLRRGAVAVVPGTTRERLDR
jgi:L-threonylcarbamoyladenylate synthase